jgi:ribosomal protein S18 acetylase RimI-like enzyme
VTIRQAKPDDVRELEDVYVGALATMEGMPDRWTEEENRAFVRDVIVVHNEIWVAAVAGAALAFLALHRETVRHLYVQPSHQNHGLGTALIEHAKTLRPGGLRLSVLQANTSARRFYERHGFTLDELRDGLNTPEGKPEALYSWRAPAGGQALPA